MPWDGTELWVAELAAELAAGLVGRPAVTGARRVAGGPEESVSQPRWSPDGRLHWVSDRTGWWNLYADDGDEGRALAPRAAEFSGPDWVFGQSSYAFLADGRLAVTWTDAGVQHLGVLDPGTGALEELPTPFTRVDAVQPHRSGVVAIAASATESAAVVRVGLDGSTEVLRRSREAALDPAWISRPEPFTFPTNGSRTAHAFWYPPTNPDHQGPSGPFSGEPGPSGPLSGEPGPSGERPPLVVLSHGGPTSSTSPALNLAVQFWTSRGLGVVDVNYGGSTGYGRDYRRALDGNWGVVDVDDCVAAALHLARRGDVDRARLVIRGGSAGGYTTLCALAFRDVFAAGASLYGVADLAALATDTHKFESRYLDRLVGPWPEAADRYRERSPLHHADGLSCPVILLQGLEDRVVPPAQAEVMVAALRAKGLPFAYVTFPGEQHGFRQAESIRRAAEAELSFYGQVLGFRPHGPLPPVAVENLGDRPGALSG
jgi:dipeptidyl aminopeptidase/acylaminoacyl peptidase